ncbi:MAG TPA: FecR domain-containing protein, partial [Puia sp.]|nr:FecR domain-containing protein [Puia sp.]
TTGLAVLGYYLRLAHSVEYQTAANETRSIRLADGTTMSLEEWTTVRVEAGYNRSSRAITLLTGKAHFDVIHDAGRPFRVDAGTVEIRDIGTSFTVTLANDSVGVEVITGKVSVEDKRTRQTFALSAGQAANNYSLGGSALKFRNAPLSAVLDALQRRYGKSILLADTTLAAKRLTVNLEGESFEEAIKVICASLDLISHEASNGIVLSKATR